VNSVLQKMLRERGIKFFTSQNEDIKASIAERFNRTLKTKMWRYFTHKSTNNFIDVLPDMVHSYNNTYHRTIERTPASVTAADVKAVRERMYGDEGLPAHHPQPSLRVSDKVRISKTRQVVGKGYLPNWTGELFTVVEVLPTSPLTYRLQDYAKEAIQGSFYDKELQRVVKNDDVYKIKKILNSRRRHGDKEYYVRWLHYPDSFNSWVKESDLTDAI
jgi:hypothetical protein